MVENIEVGPYGNIQVQHIRKGSYRVRLNEASEQVTGLKQCDSLSGNPDGHCYPSKVNGRVAFSDGQSFYTCDNMANSTIPYKAMNEKLAVLRDIHAVAAMRGGLHWFLSDREACLARCTVDDFEVERRIPFSMSGSLLIEGLTRMVYDKWNSRSYLCLSDPFVRIVADSTGLYKSHEQPSLRIFGFSAFNEQTDERLQLLVSGDGEIAPAFDNVGILPAYPVYNDFAFHARYRFEELPGKQTEGLPDLRKDFTLLPFSSYRFRAGVYDDGGVVATVELPFRILRP